MANTATLPNGAYHNRIVIVQEIISADALILVVLTDFLTHQVRPHPTGTCYLTVPCEETQVP